MVESMHRGELGLSFIDLPISETLGSQSISVDWYVLELARSSDVIDHLLDVSAFVAEVLQGSGYALVDDLEATATGQLLELDQSEVGFDSGGIAVHEQTDRSGGS